MHFESISVISMLLRCPGVPEIMFWYLLTSALGDAAITRIRVLLSSTVDVRASLLIRLN